MIQALVFDFDGTLAELHLDFSIMKERIAVLAETHLHRRPAPASMPALEWIEHLTREMPGANGAGEAFRREALELVVDMEMEAAQRGKLFPYTRSILRDLQAWGVPAAIITRNCSRAVRHVFPDIHRLCPCFLARDHVDKVKPHPEHLKKALSRLGVESARALMVGDHPLDIETGRRAGTLTAAVATGRVGTDELKAAGPHWVFRDCATLWQELRRLKLIEKRSESPRRSP
ncbi:phosphoglycolate phosphatase [Desulfacinum hydrothermale DSM 13146]|uniref:phosphoglycolate phosphatase n=2 Tax=Desulfacinum hydrothermale TaxID=109258 RepID=A0A1W1XVX6_9BACT|nr:phosphoglycolate phosphatase [Desulfacinum hydrothermale DSM 13146]